MIDLPPMFTYPSFFEAAGEASLSGQKKYMRAIAYRLSALAVAAIGGALSVYLPPHFDPFAWLALIAFLVALGSEIYILGTTPDKLWYEGRAAAESAKTLAWRYAVRGDPFAEETDSSASIKKFGAQILAIVDDLHHPSIPPPEPESPEQIPTSLEEARSSEFEQRKLLYLHYRIEDQISWYSGKAKTNKLNMQRFLTATIALELFGVVAATLRASSIVNLDLLGIVAAIAAGIASWAQTRQYGSLSSAYSIASHELTTIKSEIPTVTEASWPRFVDEAEEAISREHTLWRASRGILPRRRLF